MVNFSVFFKIALVGSGRNHRLISDIKTCKDIILLGKGFLNADLKRWPIRLFPDCHGISAKGNQSVFNPGAFQILFQLICNIALCNRSKIDGSLCIQKLNGSTVHFDVFVIHMTSGFLNGSWIWNLSVIMSEIPELT